MDQSMNHWYIQKNASSYFSIYNLNFAFGYIFSISYIFIVILHFI